MIATSATLSWFAHHEVRLAWRDWVALMSGGRKLKDRAVLVGMLAFAAGLHAIAYALLAPLLPANGMAETTLFAALTTCIVLSFTMMFSQAMESVTRAFYARDDLDLILSSPAPSRNLFAVRITAMALTTSMMSGLLLAPFINIAAWRDGAQWLAAYPAILALAAIATGAAVLVTLTLFRHLGAKRTRLVAQITAAVVGASFLIGIQIVAIYSSGSFSRFAFLSTDVVARHMPSAESMFWLPARAVMGQPAPLLALLVFAGIGFWLVVSEGAKQFRTHVVAAMGVAEPSRRQKQHRNAFRSASVHRTLLKKEWALLGRDPWLVSQTLMQILYLIPPAFMLWSSFGAKTNIETILAPVLVMAAGQLAGALAWLAISGEDAPDLVATAPVPPRALMLAKIVSVLAIIAAVALPFVVAMLFVSPRGAGIILVGMLSSSLCAILIQLWFRSQAKRSNFRRRQVASRVSTLLEALASILCAATAGFAAAATWLALGPAVLAALVMLIAWLMRPRAA